MKPPGDYFWRENMKKIVLLWLVFLLAACGAAEAPERSTELSPTEPASQTTGEKPPATAVVDEEAPAEASPVESSDADAFTIAKTPEEAGAVRARDWAKGAEEPAVTIIEYGDFQ